MRGAPQSITAKARHVLALLAWSVLCSGASQAQAQSAKASASDATTAPRYWISVGVGSQHLKDASQYNQNNPGLGIEVPFQAEALGAMDTRYALGFFRNSERARSIYIGAFVFPWASSDSHWKFGALAGVINGYHRANNGGFFPLLVPTLAYEHQNLGANVFLVPPVAGIPATLALQLKWGF